MTPATRGLRISLPVAGRPLKQRLTELSRARLPHASGSSVAIGSWSAREFAQCQRNCISSPLRSNGQFDLCAGCQVADVLMSSRSSLIDTPLSDVMISPDAIRPWPRDRPAAARRTKRLHGLTPKRCRDLLGDSLNPDSEPPAGSPFLLPSAGRPPFLQCRQEWANPIQSGAHHREIRIALVYANHGCLRDRKVGPPELP